MKRFHVIMLCLSSVLILRASFSLLRPFAVRWIVGDTTTSKVDGDDDGRFVSYVEKRKRQRQRESATAKGKVVPVGLCDGYDGILFISRVIRKAGAGTLFFQSLVDSLLYAERHNLYPYLHVNDDKNTPCYDANYHGIGPNVSFRHLSGPILDIVGTGNMTCDTADNLRPGPPDFHNFTMTEFVLRGNGLWESYFHPVSPPPFDFDHAKNRTEADDHDDDHDDRHVQGDKAALAAHDNADVDISSCRNKVVYEMTDAQIMPAMHRCSDFAVRGWPFRGIPQALLPNDRPMKEWLWDSRVRAAPIVERYFRPKPHLEALINEANPDPRRCLAMHIRMTDKASGRDKKGLRVYTPYANAFAKAAGGTDHPIYIATDQASILDDIQTVWSKGARKRVITQANAFRSSDSKTPTFALLKGDKHRSNTEALVEMYAMARCSFFVHGFSGMAEAVVYINPTLHNRSVNIDDMKTMSSKKFGRLVREVLAEEKKDDGDRRGTTIKKDR